MDSFEAVVAYLLERDGFWIRRTFRVELTKKEKKQIGRHSSPRWELDLVAYKPTNNEIVAVECKSYLDSPGVRHKHLVTEDPKSRYKLFVEPELRRVVTSRLSSQMLERGLCGPQPKITLGLVAGNIATSEDARAIRQLFEDNGWHLWGPDWLKDSLLRVAADGYDNDVTSIAVKLLLPLKPAKKVDAEPVTAPLSSTSGNLEKETSAG